MASKVYSMRVNAPIEGVWRFISDIDHWAPLVPGYIEHEIINEKESTWTFKSDIGIMKKKIQLKVDITNWIEPTTVTFNLAGINEKFKGSGSFEAKVIDKNQTLMTGSLNIEAQGALAKMVNSVLKTNVPEMTQELTEAVGIKIQDLQRHS